MRPCAIGTAPNDRARRGAQAAPKSRTGAGGAKSMSQETFNKAERTALLDPKDGNVDHKTRAGGLETMINGVDPVRPAS